MPGMIFMLERIRLLMYISVTYAKIKIVTEEEYIETVWGIGFRLVK